MTKPLCCAIDNRKLQEEGLEQDFNALYAQLGACEANVKSKAPAGWKLDFSGHQGQRLAGTNNIPVRWKQRRQALGLALPSPQQVPRQGAAVSGEFGEVKNAVDINE